MKAFHLNALIDSYRDTLSGSLGVVPEKGDVYAKEILESEKEYFLFISFSGNVHGFLAIGVSEDVLFDIVQALRGSEEKPTAMDYDTISSATEFVSLIKGNIIKKFEGLAMEIEVQRADFILKEELPEIKEKVVTIIANSEIGDFELNLSVKKN